MPQTRPLRSSTFRLTLAYLGLFSLSAALILALVYMASTRFMERQARETIDDEVGWLRDQYLGAGIAGLRSAVAERAAAEPNRRAIFLLVDRMLPGLDGLSIVKTLRATGNQTPVLFVSALGDVDERVKGLRWRR